MPESGTDRPALDAILEKVLEAVPFQLTMDGGPDEARARFAALPRREVHPDLRTEDRAVEGVPVRIYWPDVAEDHPPGSTPGSLRSRPPVVLFFHGGGWVVGDVDTYDGTAREHAVGTGAVVVSVDYRLAPEHPYPAAVDDVWAVTRWVAAHADELGADPSRIAVAGDSAGGNLAAAVALLARDAGLDLRLQLLWYPATTWDSSLPSFTENADAPILGRGAVGAFSRLYAAGVDLSDPPATLVPARAESLSGLAPAYIAVAGYDPLRDDGIRYAELLAAAGVPAQVHNAQTLVHGYLGYHGVVPAATEAVDLALGALRGALA
ncbi:alpha/beta hydrolase [Mycolicibacterium diernhoferi]|uniref:Alpha/beta hydrolase n=1 Tax=Mycolicibacterium diernhoferi TaxID=1801 RepID=A0A1Q4HIW7_9MYCO|nr:alpha/beta hydrolase [Mycolicibacterium diernhoferi]OJZ67486.1 lipase [Mycolicibacterium diernhoferi]OPE55115.1 lipase [Mycolicibacterium diernhoferi]PEG55751.1 alpha/beta hydrolase [Mycolicibacterium diernhoferi]QYL25131.1 alpha/beta hydrolase [Mycolicibacterium diernhoferi]